MRIKKKSFMIAIIAALIFCMLLFGGFATIRSLGKTRLQKKGDTPSGPVKYQNKLYEYNENILTFLVMGIDNGKETFEPWETEIEDIGNGQADALFLAVLNMEDNSIKVIGINRNTMTDIYDCDNTDGPVPTFFSQIALQHAYGKDRKTGCEYQLKVVRDLFYKVLEDITLHDASLIKGNHVHLMGESAYWYIKYRDIDQFASVDMRTKRQAQYLNGFIDAAKQSVKENPYVALQLYKKISPQTDTNISTAEIVYLASVLPKCRFEENSFYSIPGETVMGETYEEFYPDDDALLTLILNVFYEEVSEP